MRRMPLILAAALPLWGCDVWVAESGVDVSPPPATEAPAAEVAHVRIDAGGRIAFEGDAVATEALPGLAADIAASGTSHVLIRVTTSARNRDLIDVRNAMHAEGLRTTIEVVEE